MPNRVVCGKGHRIGGESVGQNPSSRRHWWDPLAQRYLEFRFGRIDPDAPLGRRGEQAAAQLLRRKGWVIVAQGESDRAGEIDLIAADRRTRTLIFVEVKTFQTTLPGHPAQRVDADKQARITRAALRFLKRRELLGHPCRFDVVAVWWPAGRRFPERVQHYEHAFEASGEFQLWS